MKQISIQDDEWASDWQVIVSIFNTIDKLRKQFKKLDVSYLREIQQKILILNLRKYAFSLQEYIIEKYSRL
jgi:GMP synthase PP-ATPase subunit